MLCRSTTFRGIPQIPLTVSKQRNIINLDVINFCERGIFIKIVYKIHTMKSPPREECLQGGTYDTSGYTKR